jgi:hypothetical protein
MAAKPKRCRIDIRCGCGGLCSAQDCPAEYEPCPMRANVPVCACGNTRLRHSIGQGGCLHEPDCDGTGPVHGRHDCELGSGCFATCWWCS